MRRGLETLLPGLVIGLAMAQGGCQSEGRPWIPPEEHLVKIVSEAAFVRTVGGDYVDGYFVESEAEFQRHRMFMTLEILRYANGDRLVISGRLTGDSVRRPSGDQALEMVPVFEVERARPEVPKVPVIPPIKRGAAPSCLP